MKRFLLLITAGLLLACNSFAHQKQLVNINGTDYLLMAGQLNEPVYVDDRSGVDFRAYIADPKDPLNEVAPGAVPAEGLEKTLQVELMAGNKSKKMDLEPTDSPGLYQAVYYPTVATTLTFRFFGSINGTPVDISFVSGGTESDPAVTKNETLSPGVVREITAGGFESPAPRDDVGFPEPYSSNYENSNAIRDLQGKAASMGNQSLKPQGEDQIGKINLALVVGAVALVLGVYAAGKAYFKTR